MFSIASFLSLALAVSSTVGFTIPGQHRAIHRRGYAENADLLEPYGKYHYRYLRLDCEAQHNTSFFQSCCHPFLKTQRESMLPAQCVASSSGSVALPSATYSAPSAASSAGDSGSQSYSAVTYSESYASASYSAAPYSYAAASYASASYPSASYAASSAAEAAAGNAENAPGPTASSSANNAASTSQVETGGFATFYYQNGNAGACNNYNPDSALIGAIDVSWYGNTGVASPLCGQQVLITNTDNGKQVTITIQDACPTCVNNNCIDLSVAAFDTIADPSTGMVPIKWEFL